MLKVLFFLSAAVLFFSLFFHNIIEFDQDLGRHLLTGKIIVETQQVPKTNLFSYTQPNFPFINSHWLSEVVFYLLANSAGIAALLYLKIAVMICTLGLVLLTAYRFSKNLAATALAFAIFAPVLLERTEIRPEIFSYLFIAVFLYVLLLKQKFILLLPILQVFWVNMHIYFILGPVLIAAFVAKNRGYLPALLLTCLLTLVNPNGISGALYPLRVFANYGYSIVENQNIFFLREVVFNPNIFYFGIAAAAFIVSIFFSFRRLLSYSPALILSLLVALPFIHIRSFPLLFLIELPVFAFALANTKYKILNFRGAEILHEVHNAKYILAAVILLTLFRSYRLASNQYYLSTGSNKRFGAEIKESGKGALDFVLVNKLHGPIFNNFDIGSYIDYRLYPTDKVFVDGRPEAYPAAFFQNLYIPMQETADNFEKVDEALNFNLVIFSHTDATPWGKAFLQNILKSPKFELVYLDDYTVVLVRKGVFSPIMKAINRPTNQAANVDINSLILF